MTWQVSHRFDKAVLPLADRHYSRQKPGTSQFVKPGSCLVLKMPDAYWVTSFPLAEYTKHAWSGAWECSAFRNEGGLLSSELIMQAVAITRYYYGEPPALGMITFINPRKVAGYFERSAAGCYLRWGYSFAQAGFNHCGWTGSGLYAMQLMLEDMPEPSPAIRMQMKMFI